MLGREWNRQMQRVVALADGFACALIEVSEKRIFSQSPARLR
jgi:hypothetical protein